MSRLEELIQKLCPDGVEYKTIGSLINRERTKGKSDLTISQVYVVSNTLGIVRSEEYHDNEIHSEDTSNYTVIKPGMIAYNPSRLNIGSLGVLKHKTPGLVSPMYVVFSVKSELVDIDYLMYNLKSSYVKNKIDSLKEEGARFRFDYDRWDKITIPVPPLDVQKEITRVLDRFVELTAELTTELAARKKQYEYYRDSLLSFETAEVKRVKLGEIATFTYGYTDTAKSEGDTRFIRITDITDNGSLNPYEAKYINLSEESKKYLLKKGDILMARTGATFGKTLYIPNNEPAVYASFLIKINLDNSVILNRYYWHFAQSTDYWYQANKLVSAGGQPQFNAGAVSRVELSVPPLDVQERIVTVLDNFDAICSDLNIGLPAEIEARQKQYEYYRDLILSFDYSQTVNVEREREREREQVSAELMK